MTMSNVFFSNQRWIYTKGATLSEALHRLADALPASDIPSDHYQVDYDVDKTMIVEIFYVEKPDDNKNFYRAGICVSWKPGNQP